MISLQTIFSPEEETKRVLSTLRELKWIEKNGYKPLLPKNISKESTDDYAKVLSAVNSESVAENYEKSSRYIDEHSNEILPPLDVFIKTIGLIPQKEYKVYLTMYGTGGSYHPPDKIVINIKARTEIGLLSTVAHEILHLAIHGLIEKNHISHWSKEHVVDLLLSRCIPKYTRFQKVPIDTKGIDRVFETKFPDVESILGEIK